MMKEQEKKIEKNKKIILTSFIVLLVLVGLLLVSRNYGNFALLGLRTNKKTIFSISDLTVNNLKYGNSEKQIKEQLGSPKNEKEETKNKYKYKVLTYEGLKLTLKENYDNYMLVKAEITSKKYSINRKIKVTDSIDSVMKKYKIENKRGTYLYGNYSTDALDAEEITDNIYLGVRSSKEVVYINKDAKINDMEPNIAKLNISYKNGRVTKIVWSYDID